MTHDERRMTKVEFIARPSPFVILILVLILGAYLAIGALYAARTPAWQVPDEPAHYNYVRFIVENRALPALQSGDYDAAYLERVKSEKFPPSLPVDAIRYESWQPPLYYILAAPIFAATGGSLLALRLFSVLLGGGVIVLAFLIVRQVAPHAPALALGTAAFVAFVPQHVATLAGAQNDSLAELLLAALVLQILNLKFQISNLERFPVGRVQNPHAKPPSTQGFFKKCLAFFAALREADVNTQKETALNLKWSAVGVLLGLALITKGTIYTAAPLVGLVLWLTYRARWTQMLKSAALVAVPALVIALPWWLRNLAVYGWPDVLGSLRHDAVVLGQPTPVEWIARYGLGGYLSQFVTTTFHSFWGQFGWMGVPMNDKYYAALAVLSLVACIGLFSNLKSQIPNLKTSRGAPQLKFEIWYLVFWALGTVIVYLGYNIKYVQFQGRYLFPALIPLGLAFTIGLCQWTLVLPPRWRAAALALPFAGLAALDGVALFRMILPALSR